MEDSVSAGTDGIGGACTGVEAGVFEQDAMTMIETAIKHTAKQ
jgi:hypothetical protein